MRRWYFIDDGDKRCGSSGGWGTSKDAVFDLVECVRVRSDAVAEPAPEVRDRQHARHRRELGTEWSMRISCLGEVRERVHGQHVVHVCGR